MQKDGGLVWGLRKRFIAVMAVVASAALGQRAMAGPRWQWFLSSQVRLEQLERNVAAGGVVGPQLCKHASTAESDVEQKSGNWTGVLAMAKMATVLFTLGRVGSCTSIGKKRADWMQRRAIPSMRSHSVVTRSARGPHWGPIKMVLCDSWEGAPQFRGFLESQVPAHLWTIVPKNSFQGNVGSSKLTGILPGSEAHLPFCENDPGPLIRELQYRVKLTAPADAKTQLLESKYFSMLGASGSSGRPGEWWKTDESVALAAESLQKENFVFVDDFLSEEAAAQVHDTIQQLYSGKEMQKGETTGGYTRVGLKHRGDEIRWLPFASASDEPRWEPFRHLSAQVENFMQRMAKGPLQKMGAVKWRSEAMATCYPSHSQARYYRHIDNGSGNGRLLTAIFYPNKEWNSAEHGGQLRLFEPGESCFTVKSEVDPKWNRLLLFWSDDRCPHEVLSVRKDRLAVTVWYYDDDKAPAARGVPVTAVPLSG